MKTKAATVGTLRHEYMFNRYEPLMLQFNMLLQASGKTPTQIQTITGITVQTLRNWQKQKTRRPNSSTLRTAYKAIGYTLLPVKDRR